MAFQWLRIGLASVLCLAACSHKKAPPAPPPPPAPAPVQQPAPPPPKQNLVVLLPDPSGQPTSISISNAGGTETVSEPFAAVRVERADTPPSPPFRMDQAEVRKVFGSVIDALPVGEVAFTLYFAEGRDVLQRESEAQIPAILKAIAARRSTSITVTGHTDSTADPQFNYRLGLRRAEAVATILRTRGVDPAHLAVTSNGEAVQAVKTARGVAERRNRRVEVIVR